MLIHEKIATVFLPDIAKKLHDAKVEIRGCDRTYKILKNIKQATDEDFYNEYLDLILNIKVVNSLDDAIAHMAKYGSNHSDAIVTDKVANALRFTKEVDSAAVYVNASTRFTDGYDLRILAAMYEDARMLGAFPVQGHLKGSSYKFVVF